MIMFRIDYDDQELDSLSGRDIELFDGIFLNSITCLVTSNTSSFF